MHPIDVYSTFMAIKLHFGAGKYDAFKFNFKGPKQKMSTFLKSRDRYTYEKLGKKFRNKSELIGYLLANYLEGNTWIGAMDEDTYQTWISKIQAMRYNFNTDIGVLSDYAENHGLSFDDCLIERKNSVPVFDLYRKGRIRLETLVILDILLGYSSNINNGTMSDPLGILSDTVHLIKCYTPFIKDRVNVAASKNSIINVFTETVN